MKTLVFNVFLSFTITKVFCQTDVVVGYAYNFNIQRQNDHADAFLLHNAQYSSGDQTLTWKTTHPNFGARGIRFSYSNGIHFFAAREPATSGSTFTPTTRFFIGNDGNVGVGTTSPQVWFGGSTKVFEIAYNRPIIKLNSTNANDLATMVFTNAAVNTTTHNGEFHLNYQYDAASPLNSALRFGTYPSGEVFTILSNGNIGMGLVNPSHKLEVGGALRVSEHILGNSYISVVKSGSYRVSMNGQSHGYITGRNDSNVEKFLIQSNGNSYFNGGNVGIGTSVPDQLLTVKGTVHAEEVIVDLSVLAPDYVFEKRYDLPPLEEVERYISTHRHLPEVPSGKEMEASGVKVGEMEMILLKKIEELTLYLIEMKKINNAQDSVIIELQQKVINATKSLAK